MKKFITALALVIALALPATASAGYEEGAPYLERYEQISANPNPEAQCGTGAGSGAFGYFGKGWDLGHVYPGDSNGKPGANGAKTGENNSSVCGNRP